MGSLFVQAVMVPLLASYVDVVSGRRRRGVVAAFWLAFVLAGGGLRPEVVLLVGGAGGLIVGVALVVYVLRALLAQAVARDAEAQQLQMQLDEVI